MPGHGGLRLRGAPARNRSGPPALDAADFERKLKTNAQQETGRTTRQPECSHARPSQRRARLAAFEDERRRSDEWMKAIPQTDYAAIVDGLRALMQRKEAAANRCP